MSLLPSPSPFQTKVDAIKRINKVSDEESAAATLSQIEHKIRATAVPAVELKNPSLNVHKTPFRCTECNFYAQTSAALLDHRLKHQKKGNPGRPFHCTECNLNYAKKHHLQRHMYKHTGNKPYQCDVCVKSFSDRGDLTRHKRIHTQDRPFKCGKCSKEFRQSGQLSTHQLVHSEERLFKCQVEGCTKAYKRNSGLKKHLESHDRPKKKMRAEMLQQDNLEMEDVQEGPLKRRKL